MRATMWAVSPFERKATEQNEKVVADMDVCLNCTERKCKGDCAKAQIERRKNEISSKPKL